MALAVQTADIHSEKDGGGGGGQGSLPEGSEAWRRSSQAGSGLELTSRTPPKLG